MEKISFDMPGLRRQFEDIAGRFMASDQGQRLITWHDQLSDRDRLIVRAVVMVVGFLLLFQLLLSPVMNSASEGQRYLREEQSLLAWLHSNQTGAQQIASGTVSREQPVATVISTEAEAQKISIRRTESTDDGAVRVWLEGVVFNDAMKWLYQLEGTHGVHVVEMSVDAESQAGHVTMQLTLRG